MLQPYGITVMWLYSERVREKVYRTRKFANDWKAKRSGRLCEQSRKYDCNSRHGNKWANIHHYQD
jgi:hypothetical protein